MTFCCIGLAVDYGNVFTAKRALQGATDLAAISAASDLVHATTAANANAVINGYAASEIKTVTLGTYTANPALAPATRFVPSTLTVANAAQVTMTHQQPLYFAKLVFGSNRTVGITTNALASRIETASFAIGSGVASLNNGIANAILGATLGTQISLAAIDYNALLSANVDLFGLANAIAIQTGKPGETFGQAFSGSIATSTLIAALQQVAPGVGQLPQLLAAALKGATTVDLGQLLDFGPYANLSVSSAEPALVATVNILSLLQAAGQVGGAAHLIALNIGANIPGIAEITGMLTLGEPPVGTTVLAIDQLGTSVHTSQIRLFLNVALAAALDGGLVNLPLYLELGYGTATLAAMSCSPLNAASQQVTLNVTPGLVNAWIGNVTAADMTNYTAEPTPTPATLFNLLGIATVTGRANVSISSPATPVVFSSTDIQNVVVKTTSTTDFIAPLITSLIGNLSMTVNVLGLPILVPAGLTGALAATLAAAVSPVDQLLSSVLQAAGLSLGSADTWVTGTTCTAAKLAG
jgi:uncharacterized membrane protein